MPTRERRIARVVMMLVVVFSALTGAGDSGYDVLMNPADDAPAARFDVFGATVDREGGALPGVLIGLSGNGVSLKTVSGADGHFRFSSVSPGDYALVFKIKGKKKAKREITVANGDLDLGKISIE